MIVSLEEAKLYLRLDEDYTEEDDLIKLFITTAEEYIKNATGFTFKNGVPEIAKMIVLLLVSHWYENRAITAIGKNIANVAFSVEALLNQLKYSYSEDDP